jgi:Transglycosylase SLT domain
MFWPRQFAIRLVSALVTLGALCLAVFVLPASAAELAILRNGFSIRHEHRIVTGSTTRLYLGTDDSSFTDVPTADIVGYEKDLTSPAPAPSPTTSNSQAGMKAAALPAKPASPAVKSPVALSEVVNTASATYHLDPDLVNSVIHAESGFNAHAVSPKGARGLMQLMPQTAGKLGVNDAFDPEANVTGGSRYLRELLERYNFDLIKALAAYNAGPERVEQYQGVPPFRETRAYVARIVHEYNTKKIAQEKEEKRKNAAAAGARNSAAGKAQTQRKAHTLKPQTAAITPPSSVPIAR